MRQSVRFMLSYLYWRCVHRDLHSFPTRRSSDLDGVPPVRHHGLDQAVCARDGYRRVVDELRLHNLPLLEDRKSTRLNSSHVSISYAVFCLKKKKTTQISILFTISSLCRFTLNIC